MANLWEALRRAVRVARIRMRIGGDAWAVQLVDDGFAVEKNARRFRAARWVEVRRVEAFRRDCMTYSLTCLAFELRNSGTVVVDEAMDGFEAVAERAEQVLAGGLVPGWRIEMERGDPFQERSLELWRAPS